MTELLCSAILVLISLLHINSLPCGYTDTESWLYDFIELTNPSDYKLIDGNNIYRINVCNTVSEPQCRAKNGVVCQYQLDSSNDDLLQLVAVLATSTGEPPIWNEDDENIYQIYQNGENKYNTQYNNNPIVTFKYECNDMPSSGTSAGIKRML